MSKELDFFDIRNRSDLPFQFYIGGRGIGKTYSACCMVYNNYVDKKEKFLMVRRTTSEAERVGTFGNPFKRFASDNNLNITIKFNSKLAMGVFYLEDEIIGFLTSIKAMSSFRGMDLYDVSTIIFDEFIPEEHITLFKGEADALLNLYETVNRNRELLGEKPVYMYCLTNSNRLDAPIFLTLDLLSPICTMINNNQHRYSDKEKGCYIELIASKISDEKDNTVLYRLAQDTDFRKNSILNDFGEDMGCVKKVNLNEYVPIVTVDNYTLLQHKSSRELYGISKHLSASIELNSKQKNIFKRYYGNIYVACRDNKRFYCDNIGTKVFFDVLMR